MSNSEKRDNLIVYFTALYSLIFLMGFMILYIVVNNRPAKFGEESRPIDQATITPAGLKEFNRQAAMRRKKF